MKVFVWIVFILSLITSSFTIIDLVNGIEYVGWEWLITIISFSLSIAGFAYLFKGKWFNKINQKQKIILAIFIPIIILFFILSITSSLGFRDDPFDWEKTWYVWMIYVIYCCIFEYKLFADKKGKDKGDLNE
jgi:hypothetical protein